MDIELEYIKDVSKLIPRPDIALEVLEIAGETDCNVPELAARIEKDPSLTANMLRLANSAYFGHMKKINSVRDIIVRLGLETVKMLAISSASVGLLKSPQEAYNLEPGELWNHSYATAVLAAAIGRHAKVREDAALYTAALLHDVGKIVLNRPLRQALLSGESPADEPDSLLQEQLLLHTNHALVGRALLQKWELSDQITWLIGSHHDALIIHADSIPSRIVFLANWLDNTLRLHASTAEELKIDKDFVEKNIEQLPPVPGFTENFPTIIDEFFENYEDSQSLLIL